MINHRKPTSPSGHQSQHKAFSSINTTVCSTPLRLHSLASLALEYALRAKRMLASCCAIVAGVTGMNGYVVSPHLRFRRLHAQRCLWVRLPRMHDGMYVCACCCYVCCCFSYCRALRVYKLTVMSRCSANSVVVGFLCHSGFLPVASLAPVCSFWGS